MAEKQTEDNLDLSLESTDNDATEGAPVIAHKQMQDVSGSGASTPMEADDSKPASPIEADDSKPASPIEADNSKLASPMDQTENEAETETNENKTESFEAISDDEEEQNNESKSTEDNSNDDNEKTGFSPISPSDESLIKSDEIETTQTVEKSVENDDKDDLDAPVPSPFSDIGDVEDMGTGTDQELISDIMKDSNEADFSIGNVSTESVIEQKNENDDQTEDKPQENLPSDVQEEIVTIDAAKEETTPAETTSDSIEVTALDGPSTSNVEENKDEEKAEAKAGEDDGEEKKEDEDDDEDNLIANIFGDSDDEEEEFEGFAEEEIGEEESSAANVEQPEEEERRDDSSGDERMPDRSEYVSDFDLMMAKKKAQRSKRRKKDDYETLGDQDDLINEMIKQMHECAKEDRMLNQCGKAATKKLKMLPVVSTHLRKANLQHIFLDSGVLPAIKDWLSPLPDNSLPHINIRKILLRILFDLPPIDRMMLKKSGVGRAVMLLFKHPKENMENKKVAGKIISNWARPIFNVSTNMSDMSREERESRDKATLPETKKRRLSSGADSSRNRLDDDDENRPRKPGDKGWVGRARVPLPSHKDYINRPESKIDYDVAKSSKRELNRFEKQARKVKDRRGNNISSTNRKAVGVSLNGSKLAL
eukprot:TCONS_00002513-protein